MALPMFEKLYLQARNASKNDIDKLCSTVLDVIYLPDKSAECVALLRQLYFILHARETTLSIPTKVIAAALSSINAPGKGKTKDCMICRQLLLELYPLDPENREQTTDVADKRPSDFQFILLEGKRGCIEKMLPQVMSWLQVQEIDSAIQRQTFSFLVAVSILHGPVLNKGMVQKSSEMVAGWLMNASLYQAQNPYTVNPFRKDQKNVVTELDGTSSTNFFTVLSVGQYYTEDQVLNIHTFSMLYQWLHHTFSLLDEDGTGSVSEGKTTPTVDNSTCRQVFQSLVGASIDYCYRILDQCDRKPKIQSDTDLQSACLIETVKLLDIICKIDHGQIPKVFRELKRLSTRMSQDPNSSRLLLCICQFQMNHCSAVAYDCKEDVKVVFHRVLSKNYSNPAVAYEIVRFMQDNLETLCLDYQITTTYFPNILKLIAWNPRTFLSEFMDIVPAMMSASTSLEVFHCLLDLPCMTASLVTMEKMKHVDLSALPHAQADLDPSSSVVAFRNPLFRPMFNFFTRVEGGHGDTINRLDSFHQAIKDMKQHPRVMVVYQVVPILLRLWFSVILKEGDIEFVCQMMAVLMERSGLLFGIAQYQGDITRIISENVVLILEKHPRVVLKQRTEIMDFLSSPRNIVGREDFYCHLIWAVGEFSTATYDADFSANRVGKVYEVLEVLSYEVTSVTASMPAEIAPYSVKVVSSLMSALAKLASRLQNLIPRAILCLTKVAKQHQNDFLETEQQEVLLNRAQELINILKLPNFASVILNPSQNLETSRKHRDSTAMAASLRATYRLMSSNM